MLGARLRSRPRGDAGGVRHTKGEVLAVPGDVTAVRDEVTALRSRIEVLESRLIRWMFVFWIGRLGALVALLKF